MKCLILAGGFATRLYPLTLTRAKALLEYKGRPVITHILDKIPRSFSVIVAVNKKFENDFLAWQRSLNRTVDIAVEESVSDDQKKGAVGAVDFWIKKKHIDEDLMIIAADNYFEFNLADMVAQFNGHHAVIAVYDVGSKERACEIGKACQVGLVVLENDRIIRLDEKPLEPTSSIVASGIYVLPLRLFPLLAEYARQEKRDNLGSFISYLVERETVRAFLFTEVWMDIGDEIKRGRISV
jgi:glucose-1-phosphate thymidylyltransferase